MEEMENKQNEQEVEEVKTEPVANKNKKATTVSINDKQFVIGPSAINILLAIIGAFLMVIVKACVVYFGVMGATFAGVLLLIVYLSTMFGAVWALVRHQKVSIEFVLNAVVFALAMMCF